MSGALGTSNLVCAALTARGATHRGARIRRVPDTGAQLTGWAPAGSLPCPRSRPMPTGRGILRPVNPALHT